MTARKQEYQRYLRSPWWQALRARRLAAASHQCEFRECLDWRPDTGGNYGNRCNNTKGLEVHHLHYRTLNCESDGDLEVLCRFHHLVRHATDRECERCGCEIFIEDDEAIEIVNQAIGDYDGLNNVDVDCLDIPSVCDYCDHVMNKDD